MAFGYKDIFFIIFIDIGCGKSWPGNEIAIFYCSQKGGLGGREAAPLEVRDQFGDGFVFPDDNIGFVRRWCWLGDGGIP